MSDIQKKFEEWFSNTPLTIVGVFPEGEGYTKESIEWTYQAAYQQTLDDVVDMLGSEKMERSVGACLYAKDGMRQASAKAALTAIKQKVTQLTTKGELK